MPDSTQLFQTRRIGTRPSGYGAALRGRCIFTVDVEDWFHILDVPSTPSLADWDTLPSRVEHSFMKLLDIFSRANVHTTCFFLGWVGKRFPSLVKEADARGHEIASHGYAHQLVQNMTPAEFRKDISTAKVILENASGKVVCGYRAPGFSATAEVPWFFRQVAAAGYTYDSSIFPGSSEHGGIKTSLLGPYEFETEPGKLLEFPMTVYDFYGKQLCVFGGGHLRLAPLWLIRKTARKVLASGRPVIYYIHPREIDPDHPRLPMSARRHFKCYVNLSTTEAKITGLLSKFKFATFQEFISEHQRGLTDNHARIADL